MNLPEKIIEAIEILPATERGMVYCAVIGFMRTGNEPDFEMTEIARAAYILAREVLDPILRRRRRDAARRLRKKQSAAQPAVRNIAEPVIDIPSPAPMPAEKFVEPFTPPLNRRQRRELERARRKKLRA